MPFSHYHFLYFRSFFLIFFFFSSRRRHTRCSRDWSSDVCSSDLTGLWSAIRLKEQDPASDVVLVEGDVCGAGASGRNGGFVLSWWAKFVSLKKACGGEEAVRLARASAEAVDGIGAFCADHGIDAHYRRD